MIEMGLAEKFDAKEEMEQKVSLYTRLKELLRVPVWIEQAQAGEA